MFAASFKSIFSSFDGFYAGKAAAPDGEKSTKGFEPQHANFHSNPAFGKPL